MSYSVEVGDCLVSMKALDDCSVDSIVTDPPYEIGFMGKNWDNSGIAFNVELWQEALRVLKPGAHMLAFGATRTHHRMICAIEDAGFQVRDCLSWLYGTGFPKSHNLKGEYEGMGTSLKPAWEPIVLARKPLDDTVADNVIEHGTGALNINSCRVGDEGGHRGTVFDKNSPSSGVFGKGLNGPKSGKLIPGMGRWPANLLLDAAAADLLDEQSNQASRFFYVAKPSRAERNAGLGEEFIDGHPMNTGYGNNKWATMGSMSAPHKNTHTTVKPITLMRYLVRLITPSGGLVLDPFTGSGTTGCAAVMEYRNFIGYELSEEYATIARARILHWSNG